MCWRATSIICRIVETPLHSDPLHRSWYSLPVVWLGIAIFAASLSGCIWLIIISARYDDMRIPTTHQVFGVPAQQPGPPPP